MIFFENFRIAFSALRANTLRSILTTLGIIIGVASVIIMVTLGSGATVPGRNTRVIVVNHREIPAGLVVDEVLGFRRFAEREFKSEAPPTMIRCEHYLAGSFRRGSEAWPVLSLRMLVESPAFLQGSN